MKHIFFIAIIIVVSFRIFAQPIERKEADSLLQFLSKNKTGTERIPVLIRLAQFHIFKPGENQIDFDSATICINEARQLNQSVQSIVITGQLLLTESYMLREKGQRNVAQQKVQDAIRILQNTNDQVALGKALFELSGYYDYRDSVQYSRRIELVKQAITVYEKTGAIKEKAEALQMLGDLYNIGSDYDKAIVALNRALAAFDSVHHEALQGIYILLSDIYLHKNNYKQAINYSLLSLKTAHHTGDSTMQLCQVYSELAALYSYIGRYDQSLIYDKEALKIATRYDDRSTIAFTIFNISEDYTYLQQPQQALDFLSSQPPYYLQPDGVLEKTSIALGYLKAYTGIGEFGKARPYCDEVLRTVDDMAIGTTNQLIIFRAAAMFYLGTGEFNKARSLLEKNIPIRAGLAAKEIEMDEEIYFKLDSAQGNLASALRHLITYKTISDSLFNETKSRQFQELEVQYETAKKEDSLREKDNHIALLQQRNELQRDNLRQSNLIKNITIAGIIFILIILSLLYYQFRKNQKSNRMIVQKNEELKDMLAEKEWWLKEVHHRVKNNLHTIICLLESQAMYLEKDALQAIEKSQHRIYAMSLIHQKLYQNEELQVIDMSIYLDEFIGYLKDSFDTQKIDFMIQVEPVHLNLQQAIPVALIINEAVTNSIKYAFENKNDPEIIISMTEVNETIKLAITDNGSGFELKTGDEGKSLGIQLIKGLSKELKGTVMLETKTGTQLIVKFKKGVLTDQMAYVKSNSIEHEE